MIVLGKIPPSSGDENAQPVLETTYESEADNVIAKNAETPTASRARRRQTHNQQCHSFPKKLFSLLEDSARLGFEEVVGWQAGGDSFKVWQPKKFGSDVMPRYFPHTKYKSFQRQLNIYGFRRIPHGRFKGGYTHSHPGFVRGGGGGPQLMTAKRRRRAEQRRHRQEEERRHRQEEERRHRQEGDRCKSTAERRHAASLAVVECPSGTADEALFLPLGGDPATSVPPPPTAMAGESLIGDDFDDDSAAEMNELLGDDFLLRGEADAEDGGCFATLPIEVTASEESESDAAVYWEERGEAAPGALRPAHEEERFFPAKLYIMLEDSIKEGFSGVVSWEKKGTAFKVHDRTGFVEKVMPNYFDCSKFSSFRRQLNHYGFTRVHRGEDRGVTRHPFFRRGHRELCHQKVTRVVHHRRN